MRECRVSARTMNKSHNIAIHGVGFFNLEIFVQLAVFACSERKL